MAALSCMMGGISGCGVSVRKEIRMGEITKQAFSCSSKGKIIRGYSYIPDGHQLPIAVVSHGFMANLSTTKGYAQFFAELGYAAFCFDFAGGGIGSKSDGDTTEMTIFTECDDLRSVITYAQSLDITDRNRLTLMGCSQGGVVSALTAASRFQDTENLILFYPAFCIPDDARAGKMMMAKFDPDNIPATFYCGPMKLGADYARSVLDVDIYKEIAPYEGRVLIVHGTNDKIVNLSYSQRAEKVYRNATLRIIEKAGHGFSKKEDKTALTEVKKFLAGSDKADKNE